MKVALGYALDWIDVHLLHHRWYALCVKSAKLTNPEIWEER